jgi:hypothetical protein
MKRSCNISRLHVLTNTSIAALAAAFNPGICNGLVEPNPPSLRAVNSMFEDDASNQAAKQERDDSAIRPFRIDILDAELFDIRRRINNTRWPERETVSDDSQGVQFETMRELASYWGTEYNWRRCEASLNALPQFITRIDGAAKLDGAGLPQPRLFQSSG